MEFLLADGGHIDNAMSMGATGAIAILKKRYNRSHLKSQNNVIRYFF